MISNGNYLTCIFINFHYNIKIKKKKKKKKKKKIKIKKRQLKINYPIKTNFRPKLSLWLLVSIILFDKFVDVMGLNENHLICIFMNIN